MTISAKAVTIAKTWQAICHLCPWVSINCASYQEANNLRFAHLDEHRASEQSGATS